MSHDQKSCDIYKRFNWHKQSSTTLELQLYHTMRPLSVDKLNIVISRLHSGQTTCQISSSTGFSIGTISKIQSEQYSDLPKSSSGYPVKLSPANVHHFKSSYLLSQDHAEVNLCGIAARYIVMVINKKMWNCTTIPML